MHFDAQYIFQLSFCDHRLHSDDSLPILSELKRQLDAYFSHELSKFDIPLHFQGTPYQMLAWQALLDIPFGTTISYQQQLEKMNYHQGAQAVGQANKRNPIAIIIPCHRVINMNGHINGYAGGVSKKAWLLSHEQFKKDI